MHKRTMVSLAVLLTAMTLAGPVALAAGDSSSGGPVFKPEPEDPDYTAGKRAVEGKDWRAALEAFNKVVAKDPKNAGAYNYLGYTYRKSGNLDLAFKNYDEALRIDPKHRGAHEYVGEAYLMAGNLAKAEEHLKVLDQLCFFGCEEYTELKNAVADYKQKTANK